MSQIPEHERQNFKQAVDSIINNHNDGDSRLVTLENSFVEQELKQLRLEFVIQLNFLLGIQSITKMEYNAIIDMMISPDHENHFMAKSIVNKKIADSNWDILMMNI